MTRGVAGGPKCLTTKQLQKPRTNAVPICFLAVEFLRNLLSASTLCTKKSRTSENLRTLEKKMKKSYIFILLIDSYLGTKSWARKKKLAICAFSVIIIYMIENRIELIRKAHAVALAEKGDIELEGVVHASLEDVEDETNGWTPSEEVDFDSDENLVDMDAVSPAMRDMFTS